MVKLELLELLERWKKKEFSSCFNFWRPKEMVRDRPIRKREKKRRELQLANRLINM